MPFIPKGSLLEQVTKKSAGDLAHPGLPGNWQLKQEIDRWLVLCIFYLLRVYLRTSNLVAGKLMFVVI